jgi:hypothetical protein
MSSQPNSGQPKGMTHLAHRLKPRTPKPDGGWYFQLRSPIMLLYNYRRIFQSHSHTNAWECDIGERTRRRIQAMGGRKDWDDGPE